MEKKLEIKTESNVEMEMEGSSNSGFVGSGPEVHVLLIKKENIRLEMEWEDQDGALENEKELKKE